MSYKTLIKTTKKTENACLDCVKSEILREYGSRKIIKCNSLDIAFKGEFEARDFTCKAFKGIKEMDNSEIEILKPKKKFKNKYALSDMDIVKYKQIPLIK